MTIKTERRQALVLQGYFRVERFRDPTRAPQAGGPLGRPDRDATASPRPGAVPARMRGPALQARPGPETDAGGWPGAPRPELLPARMRGSALQARPRREAGAGWPGAPQPELRPGMGPPRVGLLGGVAQRRSSKGVATAPVPDGRLRLIGDGKPLEAGIRARMEDFFGADFSGVRVYEGPAAQAMGALAFTLGETLYFAPGLYAPTTREGVELLGHELTHVVQQRDGRVANPYGSGVAIVQDPALEAEADLMRWQVAEEIWTGAGQAAMRGAARRPRAAGPGGIERRMPALVMRKLAPATATPLRGKPSRPPPWEGVIQNRKRERELSNYGKFLVKHCEIIDGVLIIDNQVDDDHESLAETSMGFYGSQPFSVAKKALSWDDRNRQITGKITSLHNLKKKNVLVVVTSHGNVHWLFGTLPQDEDDGAQAFGPELKALELNLGCTFVGVVLDACWSGTEVHSSQAAIDADCPARALSRVISLPVFGFNGKASSGTIKYYDENQKEQIKPYSTGCLVFRDGNLETDLGSEQVWHSAKLLQTRNYYTTLFTNRPGADEYFQSK